MIIIKILKFDRENSSDQLQKYRYSPVTNPFKTGPSFVVKGTKHVLPSPHSLKVGSTYCNVTLL